MYIIIRDKYAEKVHKLLLEAVSKDSTETSRRKSMTELRTLIRNHTVK